MEAGNPFSCICFRFKVFKIKSCIILFIKNIRAAISAQKKPNKKKKQTPHYLNL